MLTKSGKAKARRLQNYVAKTLLETLKQVSPVPLDETDVRPAIMGETGTDIKLSNLAGRLAPLGIECKNQESVRLHKWWRQAKENCLDGTIPVLVVKKNRKKPRAVISMGDIPPVVKDTQKLVKWISEKMGDDHPVLTKQVNSKFWTIKENFMIFLFDDEGLFVDALVVVWWEDFLELLK